jgi:hypothetical protein
MGRNRFLYIGLVSVLALALGFSLTTSWRASHQLRTLTSANEFLKKTVGEMAKAISSKDRQIDRLTNAPCESKGESEPVSPGGNVLKRTAYE